LWCSGRADTTLERRESAIDGHEKQWHFETHLSVYDGTGRPASNLAKSSWAFACATFRSCADADLSFAMASNLRTRSWSSAIEVIIAAAKIDWSLSTKFCPAQLACEATF